MALNVSTLTAASLKAKEVATEDYVDTAVSNMTISDATWQAKVQEAVNNDMTTINGSHIITGTIGANQIAANSITGNNIAANVAMSAPIINGGVINGGVINGVNITGAVIKASWIDYSSTGHLTNWAYFTPATMPTQYAANFAHNSTNGSLLVDSNGYVRLPKVSKVIVDAYLYKVGTFVDNYKYGSFTYDGHDLNVRSYDSYSTSSTNLLLNANTRIIFDRKDFTLLGLRGGSGYNGRTVGTCSANWRIGTDVFTYYGLSQATNQGAADPHIYTTRLTKNGITLMDVTANTASGAGSTASATYNQTLTSSGMSVTIYAMGAYIYVTIPNAINDLVGYSGIDTNISVGICTGYASDGRNTGMICDIPSGAEFY